MGGDESNGLKNRVLQKNELAARALATRDVGLPLTSDFVLFWIVVSGVVFSVLVSDYNMPIYVFSIALVFICYLAGVVANLIKVKKNERFEEQYSKHLNTYKSEE